MLNKKSILIFIIAALFILGTGTVVFAQDTTFSGSVEFTLGIETGTILNADPSMNAFNWGFYSSFSPEATISMAFFAYTGDDQGYGAVEAGFDFLVHKLTSADALGDMAVDNGFARFYDLLGIGNNVELNYSYDFDDQKGNLELLGTINMDMMGIIFGIKDYLNEGITDDATDGIILEPGQIHIYDYPQTDFRVGVQNFMIGEIINLGAQLKLEFVNTSGVNLDDFFSVDAFDSNKRWKGLFEITAGITLPGEIGTIDIADEVGFSETSVLSNTFGLDILVDGIMENLMIRFAVEADFKMASGTTITYADGYTAIEAADFTFDKLPIQFKVSYALDFGIKVTPSLYFYTDLSATLNDPENGVLPYYAKLNIELGLGGNGLFTVPIYFALTSVPFSADYDFNFSDVKDESGPPTADEYMRLLFGFGVHLNF